jgi:hypothetical protein
MQLKHLWAHNLKNLKLLVLKPGGLIHNLVFNNMRESSAGEPECNTSGVEPKRVRKEFKQTNWIFEFLTFWF